MGAGGRDDDVHVVVGLDALGEFHGVRGYACLAGVLGEPLCAIEGAVGNDELIDAPLTQVCSSKRAHCTGAEDERAVPLKRVAVK